MSTDVRIPPHLIEAEQAVLGALLTQGPSTEGLADLVSSLVKVEDFYRDAHRVIYDAILVIHRDHKPIDFITVSEELTRRKKLEQVGGIS